MDPLIAILICLSSLFIVSEVLQFFKIPRVVSQIGVGMVFGLPSLSAILLTAETSSILQFLAYVGQVMLLFFVGLQLDLRKSSKDVKNSLWISFFNTIFPLIGGFLLCKYIFELSTEASVIIGVCMSVSATAIALDLLEEVGKLKTRLARFIVSAGSIDDIVESILFATILGFISTIAEHFSIFDLLVNIVIFLGILLLFRLLIIPIVLRLAERGTSLSASLLTGGLIITLVLAALADHLGISAYIGALLGGIIMRHVLKSDHHRPWELHEITRSVHNLAFGFLVPFFFLWVGLRTDVASIFTNFNFSLWITVIAIVGTVGGTMLGYYFIEKNLKRAWLVGWAMNAKGDTELIMATLALSAGIITTQIFSSLIFMAVISTLISPIMVRYYLKWF
jgi:Kef-type K+ transport system membrane component KefB